MACDIHTSSSRLLSPFEENWAKSTAGGSGIIVFAALFNPSLDTRHVSEAAQELIDRHPLLQAHILESPKGKLCVQLPDGSVADPAHFVKEKPWPASAYAAVREEVEGRSGIMVFGEDEAGSLALHRAMAEELNSPFNGSPPLDVFQVCVYGDGNIDRTVVALRLHNALLDSRSAETVAAEFLACLRRATCRKANGGSYKASSPYVDHRDSQSPIIKPPLEDLFPKSKGNKGIVKKGIDTVSYVMKAKNWSLLPFQPSFSPPPNGRPTFRSDVASLSLGKQGTASLFAACKKESMPYTAALAAAFLRTAASAGGAGTNEFAFSCVVDCRRLLEPALEEGCLGNYTLSLLQSARLKKDGSHFWDFARLLASSIDKDARKGKQFSKMPLLNMLFSQVLKHPSMTPSSSYRTVLFTLPLDNPTQRCFNEDHVGVVGTLGPLSSLHFVGPCFSMAEAILEGPELLLSFVYPNPLYSRDQILGFLYLTIDHLHQAIKEYS